MDYTPLNNHMRVKNHMAMWFLWFLWICFLKLALQAVLRVFARVVLVWFLCGWICGFWSRVVLAHLFARPIGLLWSLWFFAAVVVFVLDALLDASGCLWSLWSLRIC